MFSRFLKFYLPLFFSAICFFTAFSVFAASASEKLDRIVAIVNGEIIPESLLNQRASELAKLLKEAQQQLPDSETFKKQVLNKMIIEEIQLQRAKEFGIEIDEMTLNKQIEHTAKESGLSKEAFYKKQAALGFDAKTIQNRFRDELIISQLQNREIADSISVTSSEIDNFLNSPVGLAQTGVDYRLSHILLTLPKNPSPEIIQKTTQKAEGILKQIQEGEDFAKLALSHSQGQKALSGGDLGWRTLNSLPTLFLKHIPSLKIGETIGPIRSPSGLHLIKLTDKREHHTKEETQARVRQILIKPNEKRSDEEAKALLEKIATQLKSKEQDFSKLAKKYSDEFGSAQSGGELGWITKESVLPGFASVMQKLPENQLSAPFKTNLGWHLIEVLERRTQKNQDMAKQKVHQILFNRKFEQNILDWLHRLKEEADIKNYLDYA